MNTKQLTLNKQAKLTPIIIERDYGGDKLLIYCIFCGGKFVKDHPLWCKEWEHLNNDDDCHEVWNMVWVHAHCNEKKKFDCDLQLFAFDLVKKNKKFVSDPMEERKIKAPTEEQTEIDLNVRHRELTEIFLAEKLPDNTKQHILTDAIYCITLRCQKDTGHGSPQAIRNYLNTLTCSEGKYQIKKIKGKNHIFRRTGK